MVNVDALFTRQILTKIIIGLVSNGACVSAWQKNPFNSADMDLNLACLVVDGCHLSSQPWQPDFTQGLYVETYHAPLKSSGIYPSDWSNGLFAEQFVGGSMLLSWDLMPSDSDGVAYISPDVWALWKPVWDSLSPCQRPPHWEYVSSTITWWLSMPTAQRTLTTMHGVQQASSRGPQDRALSS